MKHHATLFSTSLFTEQLSLTVVVIKQLSSFGSKHSRDFLSEVQERKTCPWKFDKRLKQIGMKHEIEINYLRKIWHEMTEKNSDAWDRD